MDTVFSPAQRDEKLLAPPGEPLPEQPHTGGTLQRSTKLCGFLGTFGFALVWIPCLLPPLLVAFVGLLLRTCGCCGATLLNRTTILVFAACCRIALWLSVWIRVEERGFGVVGERMGRSGRPCLVIANHTSFFDILLLVALLPFSKVQRVKMLISYRLFALPLLGQLNRAMGHLAVRNSRKTDDDATRAMFAESTGKALAEFEEYVRGGGTGGWFPEGDVNAGNTHAVGLFKKGGFAPAVKIDVKLWCVSFCGNAVTWHAKGLPGRPARVGASIACLCDSTHALLRDEGLSVNSDVDACLLLLANQARAKVQDGVSTFVSEGFVGHDPDAPNLWGGHL